MGKFRKHMLSDERNYKAIFERKVTGAVTCAGKLSLVLEFAQEAVEITTMIK